MSAADTPMPGEDPGTMPEDRPDAKPDPVTEMDVEANPQPEPDSSLPPIEDDLEAQDAERRPA